jgi:hypothetical protein
LGNLPIERSLPDSQAGLAMGILRQPPAEFQPIMTSSAHATAKKAPIAGAKLPALSTSKLATVAIARITAQRNGNRAGDPPDGSFELRLVRILITGHLRLC